MLVEPVRLGVSGSGMAWIDRRGHPIGVEHQADAWRANHNEHAEARLVRRLSMARQGTILLIHPPFYRLFSDSFSYNRYPVSLGYLAGSAVEGTDWDVRVYNADFNRRNSGGSGDITFAFRSGSGFANYVRTLGDPSAPIWDEVKSTIDRFKPAVVGILNRPGNRGDSRALN
jgi:hypothetical protein